MGVDTIEQADIEDLAGLLARSCPRDHLSAGTLRRILTGDPGARPELLGKVLDGGRMVGAVAGCVRTGDLGNPCADRGALAGFVKLLVVDPAFRGRGIGRRLLSRLEAALLALGVRDVFLDGATPYYLRPGLAAENRVGRDFFLARGYEIIEQRRSLVASLADVDPSTGADEERLRLDGFQIRRALAEDTDSLACQVESLFCAEWAVEARLAIAGDGAGLHVALRQGRLAAFAAHGVSGPEIFGPMGTAPAHRRKGLGSVLLRRALGEQIAVGLDRVVISWIGPEGFYRRHLPGARELRYLVMHKALAS